MLGRGSVHYPAGGICALCDITKYTKCVSADALNYGASKRKSTNLSDFWGFSPRTETHIKTKHCKSYFFTSRGTFSVSQAVSEPTSNSAGALSEDTYRLRYLKLPDALMIKTSSPRFRTAH